MDAGKSGDRSAGTVKGIPSEVQVRCSHAVGHDGRGRRDSVTRRRWSGELRHRSADRLVPVLGIGGRV